MISLKKSIIRRNLVRKIKQFKKIAEIEVENICVKYIKALSVNRYIINEPNNNKPIRNLLSSEMAVTNDH